MKLDIPFISQNDASVPKEWRDRSCAIVCLKMSLDFYGSKHHIEIPTIGGLIDEGLAMRGEQYNTQIGWTHDAIAWLAHNHGVPAYKEEFRSDAIPVKSGMATPSDFSDELRNEGIFRIKAALSRGVPSMVSFLPGFGSKDNSHLVLVIGYEENRGFIIHDPSNSDPKESFLIPEERFISFWRKFAIFVG